MSSCGAFWTDFLNYFELSVELLVIASVVMFLIRSVHAGACVRACVRE